MREGECVIREKVLGGKKWGGRFIIRAQIGKKARLISGRVGGLQRRGCRSERQNQRASSGEKKSSFDLRRNAMRCTIKK